MLSFLASIHSAEECYTSCWERKDTSGFTQLWTCMMTCKARCVYLCSSGMILYGSNQVFFLSNFFYFIFRKPYCSYIISTSCLFNSSLDFSLPLEFMTSSSITIIVYKHTHGHVRVRVHIHTQPT